MRAPTYWLCVLLCNAGLMIAEIHERRMAMFVWTLLGLISMFLHCYWVIKEDKK